MAAITFDTLKFSNRLKQAGVPAAQAEAEAEALAEVFEANTSELATKQDLRELELRLNSRFEKTEGEMRLVKWMLGMIIAGIATLILKSFF